MYIGLVTKKKHLKNGLDFIIKKSPEILIAVMHNFLI